MAASKHNDKGRFVNNIKKMIFLSITFVSFNCFSSELVPLSESKQNNDNQETHIVEYNKKKSCSSGKCIAGTLWSTTGILLFSGLVVALVLPDVLPKIKYESAILNYSPERNETNNCYFVKVKSNNVMSDGRCASNSTRISEVHSAIKNTEDCRAQSCYIAGIMRVECDEETRAKRCESGSQYWANLRNEHSASKAMQKQSAANDKKKLNSRLRNGGR